LQFDGKSFDFTVFNEDALLVVSFLRLKDGASRKRPVLKKFFKFAARGEESGDKNCLAVGKKLHL